MTSFTTCVFLNLKTSSTLEVTDPELSPSCRKFATTASLFVCRNISRCMLKISSRTSQAETQKSTWTPAVISTSFLLSLKILLWEHLCEWRPSKGLYECLSLAVYLCMATYPATMHSSQADKSHVILSSKDAINIVDVKGYLHKLIDVLWTVPSSFPLILLANI